MATLAVLPWLVLDQDLDLGALRMLRYRRGSLPAGDDPGLQRQLDEATACFLSANRPIERATLLTPGDGGVLHEENAARDHLFTVVELAAFAGLAGRRYFAPFGYVNRDAFRLVLRQLGEGGTVLVESRRRDGSTAHWITDGLFRMERPRHVAYVPNAVVDVALLTALLDLPDDEALQRYVESLVLFNRANTDSDDTSDELELILVAAAFQGLLNCGHNADRLEAAFRDTFVPTHPLARDAPPLATLRLRSVDSARSVRAAWMRDMYAARCSVAHGSLTLRRRSSWSLWEHLLLASFAFPLTVKLSLARDGRYNLTSADRFDVDVFEELARHEWPAVADEHSPHEVYAWNVIRQERLWQTAKSDTAAAVVKLQRARQASETDDN